MAWDLVVRGGRVVDGTGRPGRSADVGIKDGVITEIGRCDGPADQVIDAAGAMVTPGWVDLHTHYDGQVTWDSDVAPSSLHGVTTAAMGSCGVGFAPVRPDDHDRLIELMEGVEDIPGTALHEGLTWGWESFPEYMDVVDSRPHTLDLLATVPHDPLRYYVMGERGTADAEATDDDLARMKALVREALEAGAVGFSTGRSDNHRTAQGDYTPASDVSARELATIASAFKGLSHGVLQAVSDFDMNNSVERFHPEFDLLEGMASASGGRPLSISLMQRDMAPDQWKWVLDRVDKAVAKGLDLHVQVAPRPIGVILGLEATFNPFMGFPSYKAVYDQPLAQRVAHLRRPEVKARLLKEDSDPVAGDGSSIPKMADDFLQALPLVCMRMFRLGRQPDYEPDLNDSLTQQAIREGRDIREVLYDALLEDDGKALLYFPLFNYTDGNLDNVQTMLLHPRALPGLSDGGAHVGTICDASFPTFLLSYWGRDRATGRRPIEELVAFQSSRVSDYLGLEDRGRLKVGLRGDLNVIDMARLGLGRPALFGDLPAGGKRLLQPSRGYVATVCGGQVTAREGQLTGAMSGRLVRAGR